VRAGAAQDFARISLSQCLMNIALFPLSSKFRGTSFPFIALSPSANGREEGPDNEGVLPLSTNPSHSSFEETLPLLFFLSAVERETFVLCFL